MSVELLSVRVIVRRADVLLLVLVWEMSGRVNVLAGLVSGVDNVSLASVRRVSVNRVNVLGLVSVRLLSGERKISK